MCDIKDRADVYENPNHSSYIMNVMHTLYRRKKFCDVQMVVSDQKYLAHSVVLAAGSPYLNSKFEETETDPFKEIFLDNINATATLAIIEYCYTGRIEMRTDIVADILMIAGLFQINSVVESCCKFMMTVLSVANCFQFSEIGTLNGCDELVKKADDFMSENFKQISRTEQFLKIDVNQLKHLLKTNLSISTEYDVLKSVELWFNHDPENRKNHMVSLLKIVRLPLISSQVLKDEVNPMCQNLADCQNLVIQALVHKHNPSGKLDSDVLWNSPRTYDRTIMVVGSLYKEIAGILDIYDPKENKWRQYLNTEIDRRSANVVLLNDELMIIGGFDDNGIQDKVESINLKTGKKRVLPSLNTPRVGSVSATVGEYVFVIGGRNSSGTLGSVEKWDPKTQQWSYSTPMISPREGCGIGVLNNEIFVIGGWNSFNNINNEGETTVEAFCPSKDKWRTCGSLNEKRHWVSAGIAGGTLYSAGGRQTENPNSHWYKSVEVYNPSTDSWSFVAELNNARYGAACATLNNNLVVVGGAYSSAVEVYDATVNKWKFLADCLMTRENSTVIPVPLSFLERQISLN